MTTKNKLIEYLTDRCDEGELKTLTITTTHPSDWYFVDARGSDIWKWKNEKFVRASVREMMQKMVPDEEDRVVLTKLENMKNLKCSHKGQCKESCPCECSNCIVSAVARKIGKESTEDFKRKLGI